MGLASKKNKTYPVQVRGRAIAHRQFGTREASSGAKCLLVNFLTVNIDPGSGLSHAAAERYNSRQAIGEDLGAKVRNETPRGTESV